MASLEVDLSNIEPGNTITVKWRGKPVFVKHRTEEEIGKAKDEDISKLRDPQADDDRTQKPEVRLAYICKSLFSGMLMSWESYSMGSDGTVHAQTDANFMFMKLLQVAHYNVAAAQHGAVTLHSVGHVHHAMFAPRGLVHSSIAQTVHCCKCFCHLGRCGHACCDASLLNSVGLLLQWLVVVGVCTHLGCVPLPNAGDWGGWFCPCHGSHYDLSGRARKGPAPYNLEVPEYSFSDDTTLVVG